MQIESLQQYIIIDSRNIHVRITTKMENGTWKFSELTDKNETFVINSVNLEVSLADVYDGVKL